MSGMSFVGVNLCIKSAPRYKDDPDVCKPADADMDIFMVHHGGQTLCELAFLISGDTCNGLVS